MNIGKGRPKDALDIHIHKIVAAIYGGDCYTTAEIARMLSLSRQRTLEVLIAANLRGVVGRLGARPLPAIWGSPAVIDAARLADSSADYPLTAQQRQRRDARDAEAEEWDERMKSVRVMRPAAGLPIPTTTAPRSVFEIASAN